VAGFDGQVQRRLILGSARLVRQAIVQQRIHTRVVITKGGLVQGHPVVGHVALHGIGAATFQQILQTLNAAEFGGSLKVKPKTSQTNERQKLFLKNILLIYFYKLLYKYMKWRRSVLGSYVNQRTRFHQLFRSSYIIILGS
jgi:hypothetical protein